jgi:hypothetical protein
MAESIAQIESECKQSAGVLILKQGKACTNSFSRRPLL